MHRPASRSEGNQENTTATNVSARTAVLESEAGRCAGEPDRGQQREAIGQLLEAGSYALEKTARGTPNDLTIDVYRSTGPGGQSVNTTDSAVRITHLPSGEVVAMQDEKSQIQNRAKALQVLRARLLKREQDRHAAELSEQRRGQIGGGGRSEKIRTYNYKENRVSDHRINLTTYNLNKVLMGELDEIVDALIADERARQLSGED